jgi:16S rRNA C967 or C1407 C5-methylase (RsmB/RsmF family)
MLKPGGTLLYATCSILKNENEDQIAQFLHNHLDAIEEKITLTYFGLAASTLSVSNIKVVILSSIFFIFFPESYIKIPFK